MNNLSITDWYRQFIRQQVRPGDHCADATMGNGNDTLLLAKLCGTEGHVYAFDIQPAALERTEELLRKETALSNTQLILDSHENMDHYIAPGSLSCAVFNFGYLPGGDHKISTTAGSSIRAMEKALTLLKAEGLLVLCIYSGGDTGFDERDRILSWLHRLDPKRYLVIRSDYFNRPNHPPVPVLVIRL